MIRQEEIIIMEFNVVNHGLCIGKVDIGGISSSSLLLVGDVNSVQLASAFDTPPSSFIVPVQATTAPSPSRGFLNVSKNI